MRIINKCEKIAGGENMLLGMPTLIEMENLEECAELCKKLGLDFIEISMSLPQYTLDSIDVKRFQKIAEHYGIFYTIHLDENVNFSDFNSYAAEASKRYITDTIELSKKLNIPTINMHFHRGEHFTLPDRKVDLYAVYREHYLKSICDFRDMCVKAVGGSDIKICIENCNGYPEFQKEALSILLASPVFGLTFDVGHNHGCGGMDEPYILQNKEHLYHMHLHDAIGKKNHMALGAGELDIGKCLTLAKKQNCRVVLETKTIEGLKQSVQWIRQNGCLR